MNRIASRLAKYKGSVRQKGGARYLSEKELEELRAKFQRIATSYFSFEGLENDTRVPEQGERITPRLRIKTF